MRPGPAAAFAGPQEPLFSFHPLFETIDGGANLSGGLAVLLGIEQRFAYGANVGRFEALQQAIPLLIG